MLQRQLKRHLLCVSVSLSMLAVVPAAAGAVTLGIADNNWGMFYSSAFKALHIKAARIAVPWDVVTRRADRYMLPNLQAWLDGARTDGVTPMVSFSADGGTWGNHIPTIREYRHAVGAFLRRFPYVKLFTAWNEPDWIYRPGIARHPDLAAAYFNNLVMMCHCQVVAGDLYLPAPQLGPWIRAYKPYLHHRPAGWALHNYDDVRTHTKSQLLTLLHNTTGPVYLDEVAGVERRGHWPYPNQSNAAAAKDEQFLLSLSKYRRVTHIYHYQWQGGPPPLWDSGLVGPAGGHRPAYRVWLNFIRQAERAAARKHHRK